MKLSCKHVGIRYNFVPFLGTIGYYFVRCSTLFAAAGWGKSSMFRRIRVSPQHFRVEPANLVPTSCYCWPEVSWQNISTRTCISNNQVLAPFQNRLEWLASCRDCALNEPQITNTLHVWLLYRSRYTCEVHVMVTDRKMMLSSAGISIHRALRPAWTS